MKRSLIFFALVMTALYSAQSLAQQCNPNKARNAPDSRYISLNNGSEVKDKVTNLIWQRCSMGQRWNGKTCLGAAVGYNWDTAYDAGSPVAKQSDATATVVVSTTIAEATPVAPDMPDMPDVGVGVDENEDVNEAAEADITLLVKAPDVVKPAPKNLGWRLPTHKELFTLAELACTSPAINTLWFPSTGAKFYWSASSLTGDTNFAWGVDFSNGLAGYDAKIGAYSVRFVRTAP